jgi:hypothetical protein
VGQVDMLSVLERLPRENASAVFWDTERLTLSTDAFRMGTGVATAQDLFVLLPPLELYEQYLGTAAASRTRAVEVLIEVATFNPTLLEDDSGVYFGLTVAPPDSSNPVGGGAGLHVDVASATLINVGRRNNAEVDYTVQRPLDPIIVRLRLERTVDGRLQTYFNGNPVGIVDYNVGDGVALLPAIYVRDGGVVLNVREWRVDLR